MRLIRLLLLVSSCFCYGNNTINKSIPRSLCYSVFLCKTVQKAIRFPRGVALLCKPSIALKENFIPSFNLRKTDGYREILSRDLILKSIASRSNQEDCFITFAIGTARRKLQANPELSQAIKTSSSSPIN